jgi:hypothetical protein
LPVPSVSRIGPRVLGAGALLGAAGLLAGCTTTQQEAARERLNSARQVAAQSSTVVRTSGSAVRVTHVGAVPQASKTGRSAVVVALENRTPDALSDLPISVGYTLGHQSRYLNGSDSLSYFSSHLPLMPAHSRITWVFTSAAKVPAAAHLFARVGSHPTVKPGDIPATPLLSARVAGPPANQLLPVKIDNRSGIPQYQLQLDSIGTDGRRLVSAGNMTVSYIGSGSIQTVKIHLAGKSSGTQLHLEVLPTTYQ